MLVELSVVEQRYQAVLAVISAGMRETVVRRRFPLVSRALHSFDPDAIVADPSARPAALRAFNHPGKIGAILDIAAAAHQLGAIGLRRVLKSDPMTLQRLAGTSVGWRRRWDL